MTSGPDEFGLDTAGDLGFAFAGNHVDLAADSDQLAGLDRTRLAELLDVTLAPLSARLAIATAVTHLQRTAPVQVPIKHALLKQP